MGLINLKNKLRADRIMAPVVTKDEFYGIVFRKYFKENIDSNEDFIKKYK